jgi:hypothetical protein
LKRNFTLDTGGAFAILLILVVFDVGLYVLTNWISKKIVYLE